MKNNLIMLTIPLLCMVCIGCSNLSAWEEYDRDGISFEYPQGMSITINNTDFESNIEVHKRAMNEIWDMCDEYYADRSEQPIGYNTFKRLVLLRDEGFSPENYADLIELDAIGCIAGERYVYSIEPIEINGLNGIVTNRYRGTDCCGYQNFSTEVTIVNLYDEVYTILFRYNLEEIDWFEETGEYYYFDDYGRDDLDLEEFFTNSITPKNIWTSNFSDKKETIDSIISSIQLQR
jgi:hypothetical protein